MTRQEDGGTALSRRTLVAAFAAGASVAGSRQVLAQAERGVPQTVVTSPPRDFGPNGAPSTYFWDPDVVFVDPAICATKHPNHAALDGLALGGGPGVERPRPLPGMERHP
jgi:gluconolactonase